MQVANIDELAQWVWDNRDDESGVNFARSGQWVAAEFDGGGVCSVHHFPTLELAETFLKLVGSEDQFERLESWDMALSYDSWDYEEEEPNSFPVEVP